MLSCAQSYDGRYAALIRHCCVMQAGRLDSFFTIKPAAPRPDKPKKAEPAKGAKGKLGGIKKGGKAGGVTKKK